MVQFKQFEHFAFAFFLCLDNNQSHMQHILET